MYSSSFWRIMLRNIALLTIISFVFPYLTWAFEIAPLQLGEVAFQNHIVSIPKQLGTVAHSRQGQDKLVVYIQDLHCNYEVQSNISQMINRLAQQHGLRLVGVEGAATKLDVGVLSKFPLEKAKKRTCEYLLRQGKITGMEYFAALDKRPMVLAGLENGKLYEANYQTVKKLLNSESQGLLLDIRDALDGLKPSIYNPTLKAFDSQKMAYRDGKLRLVGYCTWLIGQAKQQGIGLEASPTIRQYLKLGKEFFTEDVDADSLFRELEQLDQALRSQLYTQEAEKALDQHEQRLDIMEKMLNISATPEELATFRQNPDAYRVSKFREFIAQHTSATEDGLDLDTERLNHYLDLAKEFYSLAEARGRVFVNQLAKSMEQEHTNLAIMVTGGFHEPEIQAEIAKRNWSYLCVKPRLTHQDVLNPYFSLLRGEKTNLEKLLAKNQTIFQVRRELPAPGATHLTAAQAALAAIVHALQSVYASTELRQTIQDRARFTEQLQAALAATGIQLVRVATGPETAILHFSNGTTLVMAPRDVSVEDPLRVELSNDARGPSMALYQTTSVQAHEAELLAARSPASARWGLRVTNAVMAFLEFPIDLLLFSARVLGFPRPEALWKKTHNIPQVYQALFQEFSEKLFRRTMGGLVAGFVIGIAIVGALYLGVLPSQTIANSLSDAIRIVAYSSLVLSFITYVANHLPYNRAHPFASRNILAQFVNLGSDQRIRLTYSDQAETDRQIIELINQIQQRAIGHYTVSTLASVAETDGERESCDRLMRLANVDDYGLYMDDLFNPAAERLVRSLIPAVRERLGESGATRFANELPPNLGVRGARTELVNVLRRYFIEADAIFIASILSNRLRAQLVERLRAPDPQVTALNGEIGAVETRLTAALANEEINYQILYDLRNRDLAYFRRQLGGITGATEAHANLQQRLNRIDLLSTTALELQNLEYHLGRDSSYDPTDRNDPSPIVQGKISAFAQLRTVDNPDAETQALTTRFESAVIAMKRRHENRLIEAQMGQQVRGVNDLNGAINSWSDPMAVRERYPLSRADVERSRGLIEVALAQARVVPPLSPRWQAIQAEHIRVLERDLAAIQRLETNLRNIHQAAEEYISLLTPSEQEQTATRELLQRLGRQNLVPELEAPGRIARRIALEDWQRAESLIQLLTTSLVISDENIAARDSMIQTLIASISDWPGLTADLRGQLIGHIVITRGWGNTDRGQHVVLDQRSLSADIRDGIESVFRASPSSQYSERWLQAFFRIYHYSFAYKNDAQSKGVTQPFLVAGPIVDYVSLSGKDSPCLRHLHLPNTSFAWDHDNSMVVDGVAEREAWVTTSGHTQITNDYAAQKLGYEVVCSQHRIRMSEKDSEYLALLKSVMRLGQIRAQTQVPIEEIRTIVEMQRVKFRLIVRDQAVFQPSSENESAAAMLEFIGALLEDWLIQNNHISSHDDLRRMTLQHLIDYIPEYLENATGQSIAQRAETLMREFYARTLGDGYSSNKLPQDVETLIDLDINSRPIVQVLMPTGVGVDWKNTGVRADLRGRVTPAAAGVVLNMAAMLRQLGDDPAHLRILSLGFWLSLYYNPIYSPENYQRALHRGKVGLVFEIPTLLIIAIGIGIYASWLWMVVFLSLFVTIHLYLQVKFFRTLGHTISSKNLILQFIQSMLVLSPYLLLTLAISSVLSFQLGIGFIIAAGFLVGSAIGIHWLNDQRIFRRFVQAIANGFTPLEQGLLNLDFNRPLLQRAPWLDQWFPRLQLTRVNRLLTELRDQPVWSGLSTPLTDFNSRNKVDLILFIAAHLSLGTADLRHDLARMDDADPAVLDMILYQLLAISENDQAQALTAQGQLQVSEKLLAAAVSTDSHMQALGRSAIANMAQYAARHPAQQPGVPAILSPSSLIKAMQAIRRNQTPAVLSADLEMLAALTLEACRTTIPGQSAVRSVVLATRPGREFRVPVVWLQSRQVSFRRWGTLLELLRQQGWTIETEIRDQIIRRTPVTAEGSV